MKNYFSYKMCLLCGLPKVTLEGTVEDWKEIRQRVDKLGEWDQQLATWSEVLAFVLDEFVRSAEGNPDRDFWNRIATITGGGSGPRWVEGWILAFIGFNDKTEYILPDLEEIKKTNCFGQLNTNDVPNATVEVPVTIDDNGVEYKTIFYAGFHAASYNEAEHSIKPSVDWALIDVTPQ
jgi:hypothetical protein